MTTITLPTGSTATDTTIATTGTAASTGAPERSARYSAEDRRSRTCHRLTALFEERDDLTGVSPVADVLAEDVFWSV